MGCHDKCVGILGSREVAIVGLIAFSTSTEGEAYTLAIASIEGVVVHDTRSIDINTAHAVLRGGSTVHCHSDRIDASDAVCLLALLPA